MSKIWPQNYLVKQPVNRNWEPLELKFAQKTHRIPAIINTEQGARVLEQRGSRRAHILRGAFAIDTSQLSPAVLIPLKNDSKARKDVMQSRKSGKLW